MNPTTISEARREANKAIERMCGKPHHPGTPSKATYKRLAMNMGPSKEDLI
jgi:hypothetical protein